MQHWSNSEKQYRVIMALLDREYEKFKKFWPGEEPYWKISCLKYKHRPKYDESDKCNWREIKQYGHTQVVTPIDRINIKTINRKTKEGTIQKRVKGLDSSGKCFDRPIQKKVHYEEILTEDVEYVAYESEVSPAKVDVVMRFDTPSELDIIHFQENVITHIASWGKDLSGTIMTNKSIDDMKDIVNFIESAQNDVKSQLKAMELKYEMMLADIKMENEMLTRQLNEIQVVQIPELSHIKSNWTMKELVSKYVDVQQKLTIVKRKIEPILYKHSRLNYEELKKTHGFITSISHVIKYFDDCYDSDDHLSDFD